jgi:dGTPase
MQDATDGARPLRPATPEGCVVKFADTIAYIGRDLQDAREVGLIDDSIPLPEEVTAVLGATNSEIINTLIYDLLENSDTGDDNFISYSRETENALITLRKFSRTHIYNNGKLTAERQKIERMYATLFATCLDDLEHRDPAARIVTDFINTGWISSGYLCSATPAELVRDYIAGMTDRYFARRFEECVIPRRVDQRFG